MKKPRILFLAVLSLAAAHAQIVEVDFLKKSGLEINGAGPLLVRCDPVRNRTVLANTITGSVSLIAGSDHGVVNIPIRERIPHFVKDEAMAIDAAGGRIYLIGENCLHVIDPDSRTSFAVKTRKQFEMVTVDPKTGNAFLVGRSDRNIGFFRSSDRTVRYIPCFDREEKNVNLNATPPPPIRKVAVDPLLGRVLVLDGFTRTLAALSLENGKILLKRTLSSMEGARWHWAGYNSEKHAMYAVIETQDRKVVQCVRIDGAGNSDLFVNLPEYTEGVGVDYNAVTDEVIIPYDNHPVVHVVDFKKNGEVTEIKIPAYGNDATAVDPVTNTLYVGSWAYGEIDVIDLSTRTLQKRIKDAGIMPHQFTMDILPQNAELYVPLGATAVNGSHGAAVTVFHLPDFSKEKINTGWAPVELIQLKGKESFLIFNSEDEFAEVQPDGSCEFHKLPVDYPRHAVQGPNDNLYLAYGPHQSYWPVVYIWAARNGILEIEPRAIETSGPFRMNFQPFNRRIPRLSHSMAADKRGGLWIQQNNWGGENIILAHFPQGIRQFAPMNKVEIQEQVLRETTQRNLKYDMETDRLYMVKIGESDEDPGRLLIVDAATGGLVRALTTGRTPTDICFDSNRIAVANFDDHSVSCYDKETGSMETWKTGKQPLKLAFLDGFWVINHADNTLQRLGPSPKTVSLPFRGRPDNLVASDGLIVTQHSQDHFRLLRYDPEKDVWELLLEKTYPYGETGFDTGNASFYTRGQFADCLFEINKIRSDGTRLWVTDFLSGRLFIVPIQTSR